MILESFSVMWFAVLITLGAALLRSLARVPSLRKLGNTALGSLFLFFASKLVLTLEYSKSFDGSGYITGISANVCVLTIGQPKMLADRFKGIRHSAEARRI